MVSRLCVGNVHGVGQVSNFGEVSICGSGRGRGAGTMLEEEFVAGWSIRKVRLAQDVCAVEIGAGMVFGFTEPIRRRSRWGCNRRERGGPFGVSITIGWRHYMEGRTNEGGIKGTTRGRRTRRGRSEMNTTMRRQTGMGITRRTSGNCFTKRTSGSTSGQRLSSGMQRIRNR